MTFAYSYDPIEREHTKAGHPEHHGRLASTLEVLHESEILNRGVEVPAHPVSRERLTRVHPDEYIDTVRRAAEAGGGQLDADTYVCPRSYDVALAAAGAACEVLDAVLAGDADRGMSLMRPPGHHALADRAMGFCIFANVAIAARMAQSEFGLRRVLIVDWDVHHGNGTEAIFYEDPTVGFFSTHQYPYYPGTGAARDVGLGAGTGTTLNVPFPAGVGDRGYQRAFEKLLVPFARRFDPQLIIVSAGYDAHWQDPLAEERLTLNGFATLTRQVMDLADEFCEGRLVLALEGGYQLDVLPHAILNTLLLLEDPVCAIADPFDAPPGELSMDAVDAVIEEVAGIHGL